MPTDDNPNGIAQITCINCVLSHLPFQNSKMQLSQSDLLKLLSYLEGELQARDVVIAALKVFPISHSSAHPISLCDLSYS